MNKKLVAVVLSLVAVLVFFLLIAGNAQIDFNWTLQWHGKNAKAPELGLKIPLPEPEVLNSIVSGLSQLLAGFMAGRK